MKESFENLLKEFKKLESRVDNMQVSINMRSRKMLDLQKKLLISLDSINALFNNFKEQESLPDVISLLSLPSSLRKTVLIITKIGESTADDISKHTKRNRAIESGYANQLVRLGYLDKKRIGRKVYFQLKPTLPMQVI